MTVSRSRLLASSCAALLLASCAAPKAPPSVTPAGTSSLKAREQPSRPHSPIRTQSLADCEGGLVTVKATAPFSPLDTVTQLPAGEHFRLDFMAGGPKDRVPQADKIWFASGVPLALRWQAGPTFAILDPDGRDGTALVQVPEGLFDLYLGTLGKPGGSLGVTDALYFLQDTLPSTTGKPRHGRLGLRPLPTPADHRGGDFPLVLTPQSLTGFTLSLHGVTGGNPGPGGQVPPELLPPLPPRLLALSGPDTVAPGATASLLASVEDPNGDALVYHWSTTLPDQTVDTGNPAGQGAATWTAPLPAGSYPVSLTVEDAYFSVTACAPLMIQVPNICPDVSISRPDESAPPQEVTAGQTVELLASGSDANGDPISWSWVADGGSLSATAGSATTWTAPSTAGTVTVTATGDDGQGCAPEASVTIQVTVPPVPVVPITSFFRPGFPDDTWTTFGGASNITFVITPFYPGGSITAQDAPGSIWYWEAPPKYLGDVSRFYGKYLLFHLDARPRGGQQQFEDNIQLITPTMSLGYTTAAPAHHDDGGTDYAIRLAPPGWRVMQVNRPATESDFQFVLSQVRFFRIRGEYSSLPDTGTLRTVVFGADVPNPTPYF